MKAWFTAVAAAPLLVACASAGAQTAAQESPGTQTVEHRVVMINGERLDVAEGESMAVAIERMMAERANGDGERKRVVMAFRSAEDDWSDEQRDAFEEAMESLSEAFGEEFSQTFADAFDGAFDLHFDTEFDFDFDGPEHGTFIFHGDGDAHSWVDGEGGRVEIHMRRLEREADRHADHMARQAERHAELMERHAERMAIRVERHAANAEVHGLTAGVRGVETGMEALERILERGWYEDDGERVDLTDEKRAELQDTLQELTETRDELLETLADARARSGMAGRTVRIERRDGSARAWVNGEEVTGSELDRLLEGAPDAPEPPQAPETPDED